MATTLATKTHRAPVHPLFATCIEQSCLVCAYVERGCQPEPRGRRAANCKDGARISLRKCAVFSYLTCAHRTGVSIPVVVGCSIRVRGYGPYHIGVLRSPLHCIKPPLAWKAVTVTKLDPAALRHGTRLRCGGGKHQSKVSEIYYRHKTVFMDGPTSRSVPCNWPPPGLHRATLHCLTLTSARSNGTKELVERDAVDPHPKLNLPDTAQQKLAERGAAGLNPQPQTQTQALACNRPQRDIQNQTTAHLQQITQTNIPRGSVTE